MISRQFTICIAGKNEIAVTALLHLINLGYRENLVVCPNSSDSGKSFWQPSLVRFAREYKIKIVTLEEVKIIYPLIFISLEFDRIIDPSKFKSNRLYNIHFSALPKFKGMYTSAMPILTGTLETGVTLHEIDCGIDTGPIVVQKIFEIPEDWTGRDLYFAYLNESADLFKTSIDVVLGYDRPLSSPQPSRGSSYFSKQAIDYRALKIDVKDTAHGIERQLRAFSFREYQTPEISGIPLGRWEITNDRSCQKPGNMLQVDTGLYRLSSIDYDLIVKRDRSWEWFEWLSSGAKSEPTGLDPLNIEISDPQGWTPLIRAAYDGNVDACRILLELGADPNKSNTNGTTPLMYAYSGSNPSMAEASASVLLSFGADPEAQDRFGKSLIDYGHKIMWVTE